MFENVVGIFKSFVITANIFKIFNVNFLVSRPMIIEGVCKCYGKLFSCHHGIKQSKQPVFILVFFFLCSTPTQKSFPKSLVLGKQNRYIIFLTFIRIIFKVFWKAQNAFKTWLLLVTFPRNNRKFWNL